MSNALDPLVRLLTVPLTDNDPVKPLKKRVLLFMTLTPVPRSVIVKILVPLPVTLPLVLTDVTVLRSVALRFTWNLLRLCVLPSTSFTVPNPLIRLLVLVRKRVWAILVPVSFILCLVPVPDLFRVVTIRVPVSLTLCLVPVPDLLCVVTILVLVTFPLCLDRVLVRLAVSTMPVPVTFLPLSEDVPVLRTVVLVKLRVDLLVPTFLVTPTPVLELPVEVLRPVVVSAATLMVPRPVESLLVLVPPIRCIPTLLVLVLVVNMCARPECLVLSILWILPTCLLLRVIAPLIVTCL